MQIIEANEPSVFRGESKACAWMKKNAQFRANTNTALVSKDSGKR